MHPVQSVLLVLGAMSAGLVFGRLLHHATIVVHFVRHSTRIAVFCLLFLLGASLGGNAELLALLPVLGWHATLLGLSCTLGSVFATCLLPFFSIRPLGVYKSPESEKFADHRRNQRKTVLASLWILIFFALGVYVAYLDVLPAAFLDARLTDHAIVALMLLVGMTLGFDLRAFSIVRKLRWHVLLVPFVAVIGTALGACLAWFFLPELSLRECQAVGAGYGYYSLSSILLSNISSASLGSTALLANIFRELFTLAAGPLIARYISPFAPIAAGGATSMDTCLPMIVASSGERYGIVAVFSGIVLTVLVPLLVPLFLLA